MKTERYYVSENVTLTVEVSTGRLDIIVRRYYGDTKQTDLWYATRDSKSKKWDLNYCINGFCYNSAKLTERFASRADVIKYLSELATRIYNEGYEKMIVSELTTFETILFDDKKNVPADKELTETPAEKEHEETIKFYHVRDTKTGHVENVFATSEECAKRLVFGRRDTTKSCLVIEPVTVDGIALETKYCINDLSAFNGYVDTGSVKLRGTKKHYYKMNSMGQWYELNKNNFMILWTSEIKFHVYLNEKCIGHGEIKHDKSGFMYDTDNYYGFIKCDVENVTVSTIRKKVRTRMLEYYADEISESGNMPTENERQEIK